MFVREFSWLCRYSRPIYVHGSNIKVLSTPQEFYGALLKGVETAKKRIVLSSLYLGTGEREQQLVTTIGRALSDAARPHLHCSILLDCLRGTRGTPNSVSMLQPLLRQSHRVSLHLYHTPNLYSFLKRVFPERFNEGMGLQHMKIYLFDDTLLLSGANLSQDYFTDRQDRYILFSDSHNLANYFSKLASAVATHAYSVGSDASLRPELQFDHITSTRKSQKFRKMMSAYFKEFLVNIHKDGDLWSHDVSCDAEGGGGYDTAVFPLLQMGQYDVRQEEDVTTRLLEGVGRGERLCLASGYFNLPPQYIRALLRAAGHISILAASPQAFGFFGAQGIAGHVPVMYTHFAKQFMRLVCKQRCEERVKYSEYFREGWTFHGKGLWYYLAGEPLPSLTLIGSSNYGHRSLTRDLEAQAAVVTSNHHLRQALHTEQEQMFAHSHSLTLTDMERAPDRKLKLWQWIITSLLKPHV